MAWRSARKSDIDVGRSRRDSNEKIEVFARLVSPWFLVETHIDFLPSGRRLIAGPLSIDGRRFGSCGWFPDFARRIQAGRRNALPGFGDAESGISPGVMHRIRPAMLAMQERAKLRAPPGPVNGHEPEAVIDRIDAHGSLRVRTPRPISTSPQSNEGRARTGPGRLHRVRYGRGSPRKSLLANPGVPPHVCIDCVGLAGRSGCGPYASSEGAVPIPARGLTMSRRRALRRDRRYGSPMGRRFVRLMRRDTGPDLDWNQSGLSFNTRRLF